MREKLKQTIKDTTGSTFILVIIIVCFLAVIGIVVLRLSADYIVSTTVNNHSTNNFYQTEAVLEEIRAGVQEKCSEASKSAYQYCIANYSTLGDDKQTVFSKKYYNSLVKELSGVTFDWDSAAWTGDNFAITTNWNQMKKLTTHSDAVNESTPMTVNLSKASGDTKLTIRNLKIVNTEDADYSTTLKTDLVISAPDYHLGGDSTQTELKNYIVISDNGMDISKDGLQVKGNVYTGTDGIFLSTTTANVNFLSNRIISRGDVTINSGATLKIADHNGSGKSEVWAENLETKTGSEDSTLTTTMDVKADCYISDDLNINANYSNVKIDGNYYGYNYNRSNSTSDATEKLNDIYSSAIIINGLQTTLNMKNVDQLMLAGRAFIARNDSDYTTKLASDIVMGESVGIKSHQVAYMVPGDYLSTKRNPVFKSEYDATSIDTLIDKDGLLNSSIGKYLAATPYTMNFKTSGTGYVYFFLNFKSDVAANQYFKEQYIDNTTNKETIDNRSLPYIAILDSDKNVCFKTDPSLYLLAGNIMRDFNSSGESTSSNEANYYNGSGKAKENLLTQGNVYAKEYMGRQLTLLPDSTETRFASDDKTTSPLVETTLLDFNEVNSNIGKTYTFSEVPGAAITVLGTDGVIDASTPKGIVIGSGDISVKNDFEGLILAKGKVRVTAASNLTANSILANKLVTAASKNSEAKKMFRLFSAGSTNISSKALSECITYKNWSKNAN